MKRTVKITMFTCLVAGIAGVAQAADMAQTDKVARLLSDAKSQAFVLSEDASLMESYTRMDISHETQATTVTSVKADVNALGKKLTELQMSKGSAAPWQATAIDRIKPLLQELADNTTLAINYINKGPNMYRGGEYKDYLEANADVSSKLSQLISDFVSYGSGKDRMGKLANKLEVPAR